MRYILERIPAVPLARGEQSNSAEMTASVSCWAAVRASQKQLQELRKNPSLPAGYDLPSGFLKNSDDQTVLALSVIGQAFASSNQPCSYYEDWGVVAAPNLFGRSGTYHALVNFRKDGAWGISPHTIPHHSLHAVSGTISQALRMHGPNFGVSGGPNAVSEVFLVAATLLSDGSTPGLWVVLSGYEPEWLPGEAGKDATPEPTCLAVAMALQAGDCHAGVRMHISPRRQETWPTFTLPGFFSTVAENRTTGRWTLPDCGSVCLAGDAS